MKKDIGLYAGVNLIHGHWFIDFRRGGCSGSSSSSITSRGSINKLKIAIRKYCLNPETIRIFNFSEYQSSKMESCVNTDSEDGFGYRVQLDNEEYMKMLIKIGCKEVLWNRTI